MSEKKYDQYSTPCLLVGPNDTPNPVKDASSAVFARAAIKREPGIGSDLATEHPGHVACFAVFAEAAVGCWAHVCTWPENLLEQDRGQYRRHLPPFFCPPLPAEYL